MIITGIGKTPYGFHGFKPHSHNQWEIILVLRGEGHVLIGDSEYDFVPGTILIYPPNVQHFEIPKSETSFYYLFSNDFSISKQILYNCQFVFHDDTEKSFEIIMSFAHRVFHKTENNYTFLVDSLFETMNHLLSIWCQSNSMDNDIHGVINAIISSFSDPDVSITEILSTGHYCNNHMRLRFKQATGLTPQEYLTAVRMKHAKKLMREKHLNNYSIAEIGYLSGYYDCHYFSRSFKKEYGITPREYITTLIVPESD